VRTFLGIDVGTTAVKALAIDDSAKVLALASADYPYHQPHPGWAEQDPADWLRLIGQTVREVTAGLPGPVAALSISTQGDTALPLDHDGRPMAPARTWMDTRALPQVEQMRGLPDSRWHAITGATPLPHAAAASVLWWRQHLAGFDGSVSRLCLVQDYLMGWLTGQWVLDAPNASRTLLCDINQRAWSAELLDWLGIDGALLPTVMESGTVVGPVRGPVAELLGLAAETQVVLGGHDQTCAAIGCGVVRPGSLMLSCGTAWVLLAATAGPLLDPLRALHTCCHAVPGGYAVLGAYAGGNLLRWFRDTLWDGPETGEEAYEAIVAEAEKAEADGRPLVFFLPHFYGSSLVAPCPEARGAWVGLTLAHAKRDLARGLLTGVALQTAATVEQIASLGAPTDDIRMIGGGARSRFWAQLVADALQRPVGLPRVSEAAAYGAALLAATAVGAFPDLETACSLTAIRARVEPRVSNLPVTVAEYLGLSADLIPFWGSLGQVR
jgi:xylulokinase